MINVTFPSVTLFFFFFSVKSHILNYLEVKLLVIMTASDLTVATTSTNVVSSETRPIMDIATLHQEKASSVLLNFFKRIGSLRLHTIGCPLGKWINENLMYVDYKLSRLKSYHNASNVHTLLVQ